MRGRRIIDVGTTPDIERRYQARHVTDAAVALVTPGFVDPHSHLLYSGPRPEQIAGGGGKAALNERVRVRLSRACEPLPRADARQSG